MSDLAQLVSDIQDVIASRDTVEKAEVLRLAAAYVRACREVNEKAYQCRDLLREGLRDQAISYAEGEPPLAAGVEYLSFPERRTWVELCESMGLEMRQHDLNADVTARVLDDLHPESDAYDGLLRTHRRLALGLAPVSERLRVLRRLAELDRQRSFWEKDIRTFEEARVGELEEEAEQASADGDLPRLESILAELDSDVWLKLPPEEVIARVSSMAAPHRTRSATERFTRLAEQIREAHSVPDEHRARMLVQQWSDFLQQSGIRPDPELAGSVAATRAWLDELDRARQEENEFREACLSLELAIDENRPQGELEKLAAAVLRFGLDMPELLAARFNSRIGELQRSKGRKFKLALAGIIGALLIIAGSITYYVVKSAYQRQVQEWHTKIDRALGDGNLDIAGTHLETLRKEHPDIFKEAVIQNDLARYNELLTREEDRLKQFAAAYQSAEREVETFKATDRTVTLDYPSAVQMIDAAEALAQLPEEKSRVMDLRNVYLKERDERVQTSRGKVEDELRKLAEMLREATEAAESGDDQKAIDLARDARMGASKVLADSSATDAQKAEATKLQNDAAQLVDTVVQVRNALRVVSMAYNRPTDLVKALEDFTNKFPNHGLTADFDRAVSVGVVWDPIVDWNGRAAAWHLNVLVDDRKRVDERLKVMDEHLQKHPQSPYGSAVETYRELLKPAADVLDPGEGGLVGLNDTTEMLSHALIKALYMVETRSGKRYYCTGERLEPVIVNERVVYYKIKYIVDGKLTEKAVSIPVAEMKTPGDRAPAAPQVRFAAAAQRLLADFAGRDWQTLYLQVAELARKQEDMDPCLAATILKALLTRAVACCQGKAVDAELRQIQGVLRSISADDWEKYPWMNPDDADADKARNLARTVVRAMPSLDPIIRRINDAVERQRVQLAPMLISYRPVGVLLRRPGEVEFMGNVEPGELYVIRTSPTGAAEFRKIGEVTPEGRKVDADAVRLNPRGCPVFLKVK